LMIDWLIMSMRWDLGLRTVTTNGPIVHPLGEWVRGKPWWCQLGNTPESSTRALWRAYQQRHLGVSRRNGRRSENFAY
jgi:hypothetical protein